MAASTFSRSRATGIGPQFAQPGAERQRDVLADRALHQEALGAVAGDERDAGGDGVGGMGEGDGPAVDLDGAGSRADAAGEGGEELVLALAFEGDQGDDLAVVEVEGDVGELCRRRRGRGRRDEAVPVGRGRSARRLGADALDAGAEHQLDDSLLGAGGDVDDADGPAVAQHGGAVAEGGDLEHPVRDEDDRAAGLAPGGGSTSRTRSARFAGSAAVISSRRRTSGSSASARARSRTRSVASGRSRANSVEVEALDAERADPVEERGGGGVGQAEVVGDVEVGDQRRLLVDRDEAGLARERRGAELARRAANEDAAGVRERRHRSGS